MYTTTDQRLDFERILLSFVLDFIPYVEKMCDLSKDYLIDNFKFSLISPKDDPTVNGYLEIKEPLEYIIKINEALACFTHAAGHLFLSVPPVLIHPNSPVDRLDESLPRQMHQRLQAITKKAQILMAAFYNGDIHNLAGIPKLDFENEKEIASSLFGVGGIDFIIAHEFGHLCLELAPSKYEKIIKNSKLFTKEIVQKFFKISPNHPRISEVLSWDVNSFMKSWQNELVADIIGMELILKKQGFYDIAYYGSEIFFITLDLLEHFYQVVFLKPYPLTTHPFAWMRLQYIRSMILSSMVFTPDIMALPLIWEEQKKLILRRMDITYIWQEPDIEKIIPESVRTVITDFWDRFENSEGGNIDLKPFVE